MITETPLDPRAIIVVEDSDEDYETILWIFKKLAVTHPVIRCEDGEELLHYLSQQSKRTERDEILQPGLIMLDLNLPGIDGRQILQRIKANERFKVVPVVVLTTTSNPKDIKTCYQNGANSYILKPVDLEKFVRTMQRLLDYWFEVSLLPDIRIA
ncbi:MAG: response regulator [Chloroflexota bacterium]|nr:response regulator [Chloroflexota bacterium]